MPQVSVNHWSMEVGARPWHLPHIAWVSYATGHGPGLFAATNCAHVSPVFARPGAQVFYA